MDPIADFALAVDALSAALASDLPDVAGQPQDKLDALDVRGALVLARGAAALLASVKARKAPVE